MMILWVDIECNYVCLMDILFYFYIFLVNVVLVIMLKKSVVIILIYIKMFLYCEIKRIMLICKVYKF